MMLVGIWLGLYWVLFSFFDYYNQSSAPFDMLPRFPHFDEWELRRIRARVSY